MATLRSEKLARIKRSESQPELSDQPFRAHPVPITTYIRPFDIRNELRETQREQRAIELLTHSWAPRGMDVREGWVFKWPCRIMLSARMLCTKFATCQNACQKSPPSSRASREACPTFVFSTKGGKSNSGALPIGQLPSLSLSTSTKTTTGTIAETLTTTNLTTANRMQNTSYSKSPVPLPVSLVKRLLYENKF